MWPRKEKLQTGQADDINVKLSAPDVYLRPATQADYIQWADVRGRNESFLKNYEPTWPPGCLAPDFFFRRAQRLSQDWMADRCYSFLIFDKNTEALLGGININNVARGAAQQGSLGYWLDEDAMGKGIMTQAGRAVLEFAFSTLHLARMNAATLVHNDKSRAMLMRLGFSEEGFARAYIQIDGKRQDHVLYGLNADDFSRPS